VSVGWPDGLLDELVAHLASHPHFEALIQARVAEVLVEHERRARTWLTLTEAAEQLSCTPDAVRMRINRGRLECRHHGRRLYVSAASVERLGRAA
jgi:hypothetical protein